MKYLAIRVAAGAAFLGALHSAALAQSRQIVPTDVGINTINITKAPYNASPSASDNASAIQSAINAAISAGKPLYIPSAGASGCYKYTAPLTINGNLTIIGDYVSENWGTSSFNAANVPTGTPPLTGSVLCPTSNGSDAIDITGAGPTVNISNLGILFQTVFTGTGHGINASPPYTSASDEQGLSGSNWTNVKVYGHDGNHYAFNIVNPFYNGYYEIRSYGGGGFNLTGKTYTSILYGNSVFYNPYSFTLVGGSANSCNLTSTSTSAMQLNTFIRPQCWVGTLTGITPGGNPPTSAQYMWYSDQYVQSNRVISPDFETLVGSNNNFGSSANDFGLGWGLGNGGAGQNNNIASGVTGQPITVAAQSAKAGNANGGNVYLQPGALSGSGVNGSVQIKSQGSTGKSYLQLQTPSTTAGTEVQLQFWSGQSTLAFFCGTYVATPLQFYCTDQSTGHDFIHIDQGQPFKVQPGGGDTQLGSSSGNVVSLGKTAIGSSSLTVPVGGLGLAKITADGAAAGAAGGKIELVCGTNAGTAKLIAYAGTSTTPVTILDNIGSGVTGC